nr:unnamed protein product [Spirometra erinaceieuropaei]
MTAKSARDDRKQYSAEIATSMEQASNDGDTRKLYRLIRHVSGRPSTLSDSVRDVNGGFIADNSAKVECWREHFEHHLNFDTQPTSSLLSSSVEFLPSPTYAVSCDPPSEGEVADAIQNLGNNKAPGEDAIPAEIFKSCVDTLAPCFHERKLSDPAVLVNRGGVLLKIERECNALRQRILPEQEALIRELLSGPEGKEFCVFNQPVLEYMTSSWTNLNIETPGAKLLLRAKRTPSNKSGSLLSLKPPSDRKNLTRYPGISGHLTGSTISLMHDFGASGGRSQRVIKSANRTGSTTSLLTPRTNNQRPKVVPASTGCRRKPGTNAVAALPSLSVKELFLRPQEPATPMHRKSLRKSRTRTSGSARARVFKTPKTVPRTHTMQTRLSCRLFSAKTPAKS